MHRRLRVLHAFAASLVAAALTAQQPRLETEGALRDDNGLVEIPKPIDWTFTEPQSTAPENRNGEVTCVLSCTANSMAFGDVIVKAWLLNGSRPTPRLQAVFECESNRKLGELHEGAYEIVLEPVVHSVHRPQSDPDYAVLTVYRRSGGRALNLTFGLPAKELPKARATLLELARLTTMNAPPWPRQPDGYERESESGVELAFAPYVDKKHRRHMKKLVRDAVRSFAKQHGEPSPDPEHPLVIYVDGDKKAKARLLHRDDEEVEVDDDLGMRRIVTAAVHTDDTAACANFTALVTRYLLFTLYPQQDELMWLHWGEEALVRREQQCGKALPWLPGKSLYPISRVRLTIPEMVAKPDDTKWDDAAAWTAFFRVGPSKYRKAYDALLAALRDGVDPKTALDALLGAFDAEQLRAEARKALDKKLKAVKD